MRKWRPPEVSAEDEWTVNHKSVVLWARLLGGGGGCWF